MAANTPAKRGNSDRGVVAGSPFGFIIACALYTTSIIAGAGMLGLPSITATVGLVPAIGMTIIMGLGLTFVYHRIASAIHAALLCQVAVAYDAGMPVLARAGIGRNDVPELARTLGPYLVDRKGVGMIDAVSTWLGFARAGKSALLVGLTAYVVPAMTLYAVSGGLAFSAIADRLGSTSVFGGSVSIGMAAVVILVCSFLLPCRLLPFTGRPVFAVFLQMIASWLGAIAILMVAPDWRPLPVLLFVATIIGLAIRAVPNRELTRASGIRHSLEPAHQVGATIASINLTLLAITGGATLLVLHHSDKIAMPELIAPSLDIGSLAKAVGVLLFAFTGIGIFNLVKYSALFEQNGRSGRSGLGVVVVIGTIIPTIAYVGWMLTIAFTLTPQQLIETDNDRSYPTVPLAEILTNHGPIGWGIFATGYMVALLALTSASLGFSEALADRFARIHTTWIDSRQGKAADTSDAADPSRVRRTQYGVIVLGAVLAILLQTKGDGFAFRDILSVAGYAGGGLLLLVLPFFIPTGGRGEHGSGKRLLSR